MHRLITPIPCRPWTLNGLSELRERGFDAKYVRGGLSAWYAAGGKRALKGADPATASI